MMAGLSSKVQNASFNSFIFFGVTPQTPSPPCAAKAEVMGQSQAELAAATPLEGFVRTKALRKAPGAACERCRQQRLRCDNGRPCRQCRTKRVTEACNDCDTLCTETPSVVAPSVVPWPLAFQSQTVTVPEPRSVHTAKTKADMLAEAFGGGVWVCKSAARQLAAGMPEELRQAMAEAMRELRVFAAASGVQRHHGPKQPQPLGMTITILDDSFSSGPVMRVHPSFTWSNCFAGVHKIEFNRRYAEETRGVSAEELVARYVRP